ncbi:MAG: selenocysteine lyase, partial [Candidatus Marinimicrobia bacterium]|nr:selenocysteine lyase [Candidatus Neomarinimicrobiota bacterium]
IQTRGGCLCAGTYGHILLNISDRQSKEITKYIDQGDLRNKPGWVRISLHPTMTEVEVRYITAAVKAIMRNQAEWSKDYQQNPTTGDFELPGQIKASIDLKATFKPS